MERSTIVAEVAKDKVVEKAVCRIAGSRLTPNLQDLAQIVYEVLLTYRLNEEGEDYIVETARKGKLQFLIVKIILNQYRRERSEYKFLFGKRFEELPYGLTEEEEEGMDARMVQEIVDDLPYFDRWTIQRYAEERSLRKVGKMMGVAHSTIRYNIEKIKDEIKDEYYRRKEE